MEISHLRQNSRYIISHTPSPSSVLLSWSTSTLLFRFWDSLLISSRETQFSHREKAAMPVLAPLTPRLGIKKIKKVLSISSMRSPGDKVNMRNITRDWGITGSLYQQITTKDRFPWSTPFSMETRGRKWSWKWAPKSGDSTTPRAGLSFRYWSSDLGWRLIWRSDDDRWRGGQNSCYLGDRLRLQQGRVLWEISFSKVCDY